MSEIKPFEPQVRYLNGLIIYFKDKHSVVVSKDMVCVIYHRWFDRPRGSYNNWFKFCRALKRRNTLDSIYEITQIANHFSIDHQTVTTTIKTLPPKGVKILPEHFKHA